MVSRQGTPRQDTRLMPTYLNHRATLRCMHGGQVMLIPPPFRSLHTMGSPVVTDVDLMRAPIVGCPQVGPGLVPCTAVVQIITGRARQIFADRQSPLLDTLMALTNGVAPGFVTAQTDGGSNMQTIEGLQALALLGAAARGAALCEVCG
jgi:hypothetical protein